MNVKKIDKNPQKPTDNSYFRKVDEKVEKNTTLSGSLFI
jgi:hypothetical protein